MPRIKLEEQPGYAFECRLDVRVGDLNYGDHLGYDRLLGLAHEARLALFGELGVAELDIGDGVGVVVADVGVVYQGEAFWGQRLVFQIQPVEIRRGGFRLAHRVQREDGLSVALIEIGFAAFDFENRRPTRLPGAFAARLRALESGHGNEVLG